MDDLEREEFLSAPLLFKYGPLALVASAVVLTVVVCVASVWRVDASRKTEYQRIFAGASAAATATAENANQVLSRLRQAGHHAETARSRPELLALTQTRLGLGDLALSGVLLDAAQSVVAGFGAAPLGLASGAQDQANLAATAVRAAPDLKPGALAVIASAVHGSGPAVVPVVYRLAGNAGTATDLVFLVAGSVFIRPAVPVFGPAGGRLELADRAGSVVLSMQLPVSGVSAVGSVADAMAAPASGAGQRFLMAASAQEGALWASVGPHETDALLAYHGRVAATWLIAGGGLTAWAVLALFTGGAIRRFARKEAYLRRLATTDVLTGLPNRRSFQGLLRKALARAERKNRRLALLFVDLDNFKHINDSAGHGLGDALLRHVGQVLRATIRPQDHVCRLGGDEFTLLIENVRDPALAQALGDRILAELRVSATIQGVELSTRASIGIALYPDSATTEADLMRYADTAMYQAKAGGKGQCLLFEAAMTDHALAHAQLARELERAICHNELFLEYQPKFELDTGAVAGHEALVRWQHPVRGRMAPGDFIPLAESSGLISELGNWVLHRAVAQIRQWHRDGAGWQRVAVNVSPLQFRSERFADQVAQALGLHGVAGDLLQVEITESSLATDVDRAQSTVRQLRQLGVLVAVDDFGTGYSSLGSLQQFELDMLKVDRSFVEALGTRQGEQICRAVVTLGQALGLRIIAEGIETQAQADILRRLGCDQGQGYFFARPAAADIAGKTRPLEGGRLRLVG